MDVVIEYLYPWLPPRCNGCKKWGHVKDACLAVGTEQINIQENSKPTEPTNIETEKTTSVEASIQVSEAREDENVTVNTGERETETENEQWVTPNKSGRSPGKKKEVLKYGEVSILSNFYSVLSEKEEKDEEGTELERCGGTSQETEGNSKSLVNLEDKTECSKANKENKAKSRGATPNIPPRKFLPRNSKTTQKAASNPLTQPGRDRSTRLPQQ